MSHGHRKAYNFTLRQLQYALAVAEELSFRKAAEACGVSQPSLSAQVAQLEEVLGVELFERDNRRVLLTAAGQVLLERAKAILAEVDQFDSSARLAQNPFEGQWRVGVIPTMAPYLLPTLAKAIEAAYPNLSLFWREDRTEVLKAALQRGELDLALLALEADLGDLETAALGWEPFVLAMEPGHPLEQQTQPLEVEQLREYPLLLLEEGHCLRDQAIQLCSGVSFRRAAFDATSLTTVTQMVAAGWGLTFLPETAVPIECQRTSLVIKPLCETNRSGRTVGFAWRNRSPFGDVFREFAAKLADHPIPGVRRAI